MHITGLALQGGGQCCTFCEHRGGGHGHREVGICVVSSFGG